MPNEFEKLSAQITRAIEAKFLEQNIRVRAGAELEYIVSDSNMRSPHPNLLGIPGMLLHPNYDEQGELRNADPSSTKPDFEKDPLFPNSRIISTHYKEHGNSHYETVFSYNAEQSNPARLGWAIESTKKELTKKCGKRGMDVDFSSVPKDSTMTNGMHITLSLEDATTGEAIFPKETIEGRDPLLDRLLPLCEHMLPTLSESVPLCIPSDQSFSRIHNQRLSQNNPPTDMKSGRNGGVVSPRIGKHTSPYIEIRLAGSDANAHHVMATAMTALHNAFTRIGSLETNPDNEKQRIFVPTPGIKVPRYDSDIAKNLRDATLRMERGNHLRQTLNDLSSHLKLGDKFCQSASDYARDNIESADMSHHSSNRGR